MGCKESDTTEQLTHTHTTSEDGHLRGDKVLDVQVGFQSDCVF